MKTTITTVGLKRLAVATLFACGIVHAQSTVPVMQPTEGDFEARDFHFQSGQTLPTVKLHYATLGTPTRGADGIINNAVLLLHGTTGTGRAYLTPLMQKELFAAGQPLVRRPKHSAWLALTYAPVNRGTVSLAMTYVGVRQDRDFLRASSPST